MKKKEKYIEDDPAGVVYSKINITLHDIHAHRILFSLIKKFWLTYPGTKYFSPISVEILNNLPLLSFVPAFFQLWTLCRFCELKQIKISSIKNSANFDILSSKSDHQRSVPFLPLDPPEEVRKIKDKTKLIVVSYDSYKDSIIRAKTTIGFSPAAGILDCTHIFRHLEASFLYKKGVSLSNISYKMGHLHDKTTLEYIHKDWNF